ncbi:MAG: ComF family protein, partial [bacterium]
GFNQSALLAGQLAKAFSVDCVELLTRIQPTNSQMQLTRIDRWKNVEHCFAQNPKYSFQNFEDKLIILIDDVATSGATIESCWSVLRRHGLRHVVGLVLAHGQ